MQNEFLAIDLRGNKHTVRRCTNEDVERHFDIVKHLIPENEHAAYKQRMFIAVGALMSFCIDDDCFLYMRKTRPCFADAYSLYGKDQSLKTLAMFACILMTVDKRLLKISFHTHAGRTIHDFKSIIPTFSIRRQAMPHHPVIVRADYLRQKFYTLYDKRGIKWEVS